MNILIKNADFSEVSIGKVDTVITLEKNSILTNVYLSNSGLSYIATGYKLFAVDVSSLVGKTIEIKGYIGSARKLGVFYPGDCPTVDTTFTSDSEVTTFKGNMGELISILNYPDDEEGIITKTVVVPTGAKTLFVSVGSSADINELYVKYSLI